MTVELLYLTIYAFVIIATTLVQQLTSIGNVGLRSIFGSRENVHFTGAAARLERAVVNSVVAMSLFAPAVLILNLLQVSTKQTIIAVQAFVIARIFYSISYGLNIPGLRSLCWTIGFICILFLYFSSIFPPVLQPDQ